jgi:hypothetical protein
VAQGRPGWWPLVGLRWGGREGGVWATMGQCGQGLGQGGQGVGQGGQGVNE